MKCKRYILGIGTNDSKTLRQETSLEFFVKTINDCCKKHHCPFSWTLAKGGYINNDNVYIEENSIILSIINPKNSEVVDKIAKELCVLLNQECISVTVDEVERHQVSAS